MVQAFKDYKKDQTFDCDIVIVGTGAGGAVVGAELAEAGHDVVFVEEGAYHDTSTFNPYMSESIPRLYRDGGVRSVTAHEREQRIAALVQQGQHQDDASDVEDVRGEIQKMNSPATSGTRH